MGAARRFVWKDVAHDQSLQLREKVHTDPVASDIVAEDDDEGY